MTENKSTVFEDSSPYDRSLVRVATVMPIVIVGPVFLLLAFTEPALRGFAIALFFIVPLVILMTVYGLGVPGRVVVSEWGVVVKHGLLVRIKIPVEDIMSITNEPPPWWLNYYYLYANAQWLRVGKKSGLLKWWYIPTTSTTKLKLVIESVQNP
jgi:hypothetical protein